MLDDPYLEMRLKEFPHLIPCPKHRWHWLDRNYCKTCNPMAKDCLLNTRKPLTKETKNLRLYNSNQTK